jgi:hypothetical protein
MQQLQPQEAPDSIMEHNKSGQRLSFESSSLQLNNLERGLQNEKPPLLSVQDHQLCYDFEASS